MRAIWVWRVLEAIGWWCVVSAVLGASYTRFRRVAPRLRTRDEGDGW